MRYIIAAVLIAVCLPALADEEVSPSEFRDYAEGWTLHFERDGERWGEEQFLQGGATLWRYQDGSCSEGAWRDYDGDVCFYYGLDDGVLCWQMLRDDDGLYARLETEGEGQGMVLRITGRDRKPLLCGGPGVQL